MKSGPLFTIGHSTHSFSVFRDLLRRHGITAVADVRSIPVSRFAPQFNRDAINRSLCDAGIKYVFLGKELGARTNDPDCYIDGRVQYKRLARTAEFTNGIARLLKGAEIERIAIMCTEQEPLDCHRTILIARVISEYGAAVDHIHGDGHAESHALAMRRLMTKFGIEEDDLLYTPAERLEEALSRQERRIAYFNEDFASRGH
ncbi:DUF488 domain-containing protein [Planomonospora parontospora]|uniref:DUF488 domain-containing protein n=1 Tax=Planomonospora parontospora TaxID=58119 RepID=UPI00166FF676|nr:DUF488 domain-containing protein [Planomonospora parontospora]GGL57849.1 hypothetical protein GCM10014719_69090 [Planomonospora parontospora subsp. antibiotica]GII20084.1 hypothetical protein Ppa05_68100 [Planomonospora parontospora subsp. antibiotica]